MEKWTGDALEADGVLCEALNCIAHDGCWRSHLRKTAAEPLRRGILELGVLWSYFADHRKKQAANEEVGPFSLPRDLKYERFYEAVEKAYILADPEGGHLFLQKDHMGARKLIWNLRLSEILDGSEYADRPSRRMSGSDLLLKAGPIARPGGPAGSDLPE